MQVLSFAFYAAAALLVVVGGLWLRQLVGARQAPPPSSEPYECGEAPVGSAYVPFEWPYLRLVVLLVALEAEVLLALPWVWVQRSLPAEAFWVELALLLGPLVAVYGYAWREGIFRIELPKKRSGSLPSLPLAYQQLNAYLTSLGPKSSSCSSLPASAEPLPAPDAKAAPQTPPRASAQTPDAQYCDPGKTP